jgi:hypothetical protein
MRAAVLSIVVSLALACVPSAALGATASANWAGYAVHRAHYSRVSAQWQQPRPVCSQGHRTYSAMWVGLGGYSLTSKDVEQIGTELDCTSQGRVVSNAWYELVPSRSHTLQLRVRPGDKVAASVQSTGGAVVVSIRNLTSHQSFQRTLHPQTLDITSAEWILEAPSACIVGTNACQTLPLTDFGQATFKYAHAQALSGKLGTISHGPWRYTKITLVPGGQQFVSNQSSSSSSSLGTASPSALNRWGGSFSITYGQAGVQARPRLATRLPSGPVYVRH